MAASLQAWSEVFRDETANTGVGAASDVIDSVIAAAAQGSGDNEVQAGINKSLGELKDVFTKLGSGDPGAIEEAHELEAKWAKEFKNACAAPKTFGSFWQAAHFDERKSYGTIHVEQFQLQNFQILQSDVSSLGEQRDRMVPLINAAKQTQTLDAVKALLTADIAYAKAIVDLSGTINDTMPAMIDAGLPDFSTEVQAASTALVVANQ
ncbi:hypothetical protein AK830_g3335 [Neonectria ditissima]|uniref:Uncharacterized protein n=1 Tax=Neonectria ditissima TaxID=78410 RepID=A0A0P7AZL4_9HYPO|nr:hypothetical protein AK830_g3335 [Neonectria ditissima]